jgi:hypothetical protein
MKNSKTADSAALSPLQESALQKLLPIRVGAIFMDESAARTRIVLELLRAREHKISNVIWFCPAQLMHSIHQRIRALLPDFSKPLRILSIESMSYMSAMATVLGTVNDQSYVILDESHHIKRPHTRRSDRIIHASAPARYRLILCETPICQGVEDLYNQYLFLSELILGYSSYYSFASNHLEFAPGDQRRVVRCHNLEFLTAKIAPYTFQAFTDSAALAPSPDYQVRQIRMTPLQEYFYRKIKADFLDVLDFSKYSIFSLFIRLQQVLSGFYKKNDGDCISLDSTRSEALLDYIDEYRDCEKMVIWSKFRYDQKQICSCLAPGECAIVDSSMDYVEREYHLRSFQLGDKRFLLLNLRAGKYNLDLSMADNILFYSNSFSYGDRVRAEKSCLKNSPRDHLTCTDFICRDSLDDWIHRALTRRKHVVEAFQQKFFHLSQKEKIRWVNSL